MALPLAINTDDTSCFGNLHHNSTINWFHYIRSLQVFPPKCDIFGCSEDAGNEQDSGKKKNQQPFMGILIFWSFIGTGVCGQITFHVTQWYWLLFPLFSATGAQCTPLLWS